MKTTIVLIISLLASTFAYSGNIECTDQKGVWSVSLSYQDGVANKLEFFKNEELQKSFDTVSVNTSRFKLPFSSRGLIQYEINLGGVNYFDFERRFQGQAVENSFAGAFLISSNPIGVETNVNCTYRD